MAADSVRKRAKHTRSRRGCTVCRIRRIRCDENRPTCNNCTSTGRKCEGMSDSVWNMYTPTSVQPRQPRFAPEENRSFAYFRQNTSAQFAAPFWNEFWTCLVLQIGERERCIKQSVIALGALHESFADEHLPLYIPSPLHQHTSYKPDLNLTNLATTSYTRALRGLYKHILPDSYEGLHISLLCCILFTCFEWLRGCYTAATTHLKFGLHILRQWSSSCTSPNTPTAHFVRRHLAPMFVRLSIQARTSVRDMGPMPWLSDGLFAASTTLEVTNKKQHLLAARNALDVLCSEVYLQPSDPTQLSGDFSLNRNTSLDFGVRLAKWHNEYQMHLLPPSSSERNPRPENLNLTLWYTSLCLLQLMSSMRDPMAIDACMLQFARVIYLSRLLIECPAIPHSPPAETKDTRRFRIDMEMVPMLYHVASRCRDPALRREAIALLHQGASREGLWDSQAVARLAEEMMAFEEEGIESVELLGAESIAARQRVYRLVEETNLQTRSMRVKFQRWGESEYGAWRVLSW